MKLFVQCLGFKVVCVHQVVYLGSWLVATTAFEPGKFTKECSKRFERVLFQRFLNKMLQNISDEIRDLACDKSFNIARINTKCGTYKIKFWPVSTKNKTKTKTNKKKKKEKKRKKEKKNQASY